MALTPPRPDEGTPPPPEGVELPRVGATVFIDTVTAFRKRYAHPLLVCAQQVVPRDLLVAVGRCRVGSRGMSAADGVAAPLGRAGKRCWHPDTFLTSLFQAEPFVYEVVAEECAAIWGGSPEP
jgi:hypothetical protein